MLSKIVAVGVETGGMSWMVNSISVKVFADISLSEQIHQTQIKISTDGERSRRGWSEKRASAENQ